MTPVDRAHAAPREGSLRGSGWRSTFTSFGEREYVRCLGGSVAFFMGIHMMFAVRAYLAFDLTGSASALGLLGVAIALPVLFTAPFAGVLADRLNKRTLLLVTEAILGAAGVALSVLIIGSWIEYWHILAVSAVTGMLMSLNMPARQALVPQLVPPHKLTNAISLQMGGATLTQIIGPGAAGLLIPAAGFGIAHLVPAVVFLLSGVIDLGLPRHGMRAAHRGGRFLEDLAEGFRFIARHPVIRILLLGTMLGPLFGFTVQQMLPVFANDVFGTGAVGYGLLGSMMGTGGLIGALASASLHGRPAKGRLLLAGGLLMGFSMLAFASAPWFVLALALLALTGAGQMFFNATNNGIIQSLLTPEVRGRVSSVQMISFGISPLAGFPVAVASDAFGVRPAVGIFACLLLVGIVVVFTRSPRVRRLRLEPRGAAELSPVRTAELAAAAELSVNGRGDLARTEVER